jgi:excisionase family DNA binding protein
MSEQEDLVTTEELSRKVKLAAYTLRKKAKEGRIPAVKFGPSQWRFNVREVIEALKSYQA